jgi:potassium/hydrogen antiporter
VCRGGSLIFDVVFFVVLVSVLLQGTALLPLVRGSVWRRPSGLGAGRRGSAARRHRRRPGRAVRHDDLPIAHRRMRDLPGMLDATLIAAIVRDNRVLIAKGDTVIEPGDVLLITAQRQGDAIARLTAWARGEDAIVTCRGVDVQVTA